MLIPKREEREKIKEETGKNIPIKKVEEKDFVGKVKRKFLEKERNNV